MEEEVKFWSQAKPHWRRFRRLMLYTSPWLLLGIRFIVVNGHGPTDPFVVGLVAGTVLVIGINFRLSAYWIQVPVTVSKLGLQSVTAFGFIRELPWGDVASASSFDEFIYVHSSAKPKVCLFIPLFLKDQQGFYDYVCAHASEGNPLRVWIEALPERKGKVG